MMTAVGLLIVRLMVGLALTAHGAQKGFGWFGGHGLKASAGFFESMGFRPGIMFAVLASYGEILGGVLTASGLFGPVGPAIVILVMIVAAGSVHYRNGFFSQNKGYEINVIYIAAALALAIVGPGTLSLDAALGLTSHITDGIIVGTILAGVVLGFFNLLLRRTPSAPSH